MKEKIVNIIYNYVRSSSRGKLLAAGLLGTLFLVFTSLFIIVPVEIEKSVNIEGPNIAVLKYVSFVFFTAGCGLILWSNLCFIKIKGTPVHLKPPPKLVANGPFTYVRNPMHAGIFLILFAFGLYYSSILSVLVFTPVYILLDIWFIKNIEEPELVKRLGDDYIKYKDRTPMFIPRIRKTTL